VSIKRRTHLTDHPIHLEFRSLDCSDIPYRNFRVLPPDPHHFDGDGDGIGCEA